MQAFADLISNLENTSKTTKKLQYLQDYFEHVSDEDRVWTIALFTHRRPRRQVNTRLLSEWAASYSNIDYWLFQESYGVVGDLAETIALVIPKSQGNLDYSLSEWIIKLSELQDQTDEEKEAFIKEAWRQLSSSERFVFNKLITGG